MTTTKTRTFINGNLFAEQEQEFQDLIDIEDGVASQMSEEDLIASEVEVSPLFLEEPDEFVSKEWMMDVLTNKYNIVSIDTASLINSILDQFALHGMEDVSITYNGIEYK